MCSLLWDLLFLLLLLYCQSKLRVAQRRYAKA